MEKELTRETVDPRYTWDLTRIYASDEAWEEAFVTIKAQADAFAQRAGTLNKGRESILETLAAMAKMDEEFEALYVYAMMKNNEDSTNAKYQAMSDRAGTLAGVVAASSAFMEPELLALPEGEVEAMIADPAFEKYDRYLSGVLRMKAHTLTANEEKLMAMASDACNAASNAYEMLSYADMNLGMTRGENGEKVQLTDARLLSLLAAEDERGLMELCISLEKWDRDRLSALLDEAILLLRDALLCAAGALDEADPLREEAARQASALSPRRLLAAAAHLKRLRSACAFNIGAGHLAGWLCAGLLHPVP